MEYREIIASNIDEAKYKIKKEYGDKARIIKVAEFNSGGILGIGRKKNVKVLISISDTDLLKKYKENMGLLRNERQLEEYKEKRSNSNNSSIHEILQKLSTIEDKINKEPFKGIDKNEHINLIEIRQILKENDFYDDFIDRVVENIKDILPYSKIDSRSEVHKFVYQYIKEQIMINSNTKIEKKRIIILVGPTGVGKTTTIAKIAANAIREKKRVELITIDGYRIGAKYQLEKYAEYMHTPMTSAEDNLELQKIIDLSDADLILIDTIGRSAKDELNLVKMKQLLQLERHKPEYVLTVAASTKPSDIKKIFKSFEIFDYSSVIITKVDESETIGAVINEAIEKKRFFIYYTDGQRVPNDIERATSVNLMSKIQGLEIDVYLNNLQH